VDWKSSTEWRYPIEQCSIVQSVCWFVGSSREIIPFPSFRTENRLATIVLFNYYFLASRGSAMEFIRSNPRFANALNLLPIFASFTRLKRERSLDIILDLCAHSGISHDAFVLFVVTDDAKVRGNDRESSGKEDGSECTRGCALDCVSE